MTVVLETFSEILYRTKRDRVSAPLPKKLAHHLHAAKPEHTREQVERLTASAFLDRVQARADLSREDAQTATAAVLSALEEATGEAVLSDIGDSLPASYAEIFPFSCLTPTRARRDNALDTFPVAAPQRRDNRDNGRSRVPPDPASIKMPPVEGAEGASRETAGEKEKARSVGSRPEHFSITRIRRQYSKIVPGARLNSVIYSCNGTAATIIGHHSGQLLVPAAFCSNNIGHDGL